MKYVFCQFDTRFLYPTGKIESLADQYYREFWSEKAKHGYCKPSAFWEVPTWITEIDGILSKNGSGSELKIISSQADFDLSGYSADDIFLFSALDINKQYIKDLGSRNHGKMLLVGGYIDGKEYFADIPGILWRDSIRDFCEGQNLKYSYEVSYQLFAGVKTIPRLTLSTGCLHNCRFCSIENELKEHTWDDIRKQVDSWKVLKYRLVYVNDKTFGQANNYKWLRDIKFIIRAYNPEFEGFIVQTTARKCKDYDFCRDLKTYGVKFVEIGLESHNDRILQKYQKPHNVKMINRSFVNLAKFKINIIPNIIIGLIGESIHTYKNTIDFLTRWSDCIFSLNIYNLAVYDNTDLADEVKLKKKDQNEMESSRSYHTAKDKQAIMYFYNLVFKLGLSLL